MRTEQEINEKKKSKGMDESMKRRMAAFVLGAAMVVSGGLAGYGTSKVVANEVDEKTVLTEAVDEELDEKDDTASTENAGNLKTGLAIMTSVGKSVDAGEDEGMVQTDFDVAAVVVDGEGRIVDCTIDSIQAQVKFDGEGKITTDLTSEFQTKQELGEQYGLKSASSIGKEWNEQADAFAEYCVGKTVDEISGIAVTEEGTAEDEDLAASCTIYFGGFQELVVKAVANAE